jgi:hypothetical protein
VALKFLHADRPDLTARFGAGPGPGPHRARARLQGLRRRRVAGRSFIAMQYIDARTFGAAVAT